MCSGQRLRRDGEFTGYSEDGENEKEGKKTDDGNDGEDDSAEVFAALDFAVDAEDAGFVFVAVGETINANGESDDGEDADDDENCFHDLIIA